MITSIAMADFHLEATTTALDGGVIYRFPVPGKGVALMASTGYSRPPSSTTPTISRSQLRRQSLQFDFFGYRGCDAEYHYFLMPDGHRCRLTDPQWEHQSFPFTLGWCVFLTFVQGTVTVPDLIAMADVEPQQCQWALNW